MQAPDKTPGGSAAGQAAQTPGTAGSKNPGTKAAGRPGVQHARRAAGRGQEKYAGSWAEYLWHRLAGTDLMNQAMLLAATLLVCAVPFLLVAAAPAGRSAVTALTARLGLNQQAAAGVGQLFTSSSATSNAVTGLSWVFFILAGIAAATAIQRLYQRVFGQEGVPGRLRVVIWLALAAGWGALGTAAGPGFRASAPVLWWLVNIAACIGFWWFTTWSLWPGGSPGAGLTRAPWPPARAGWACWRSSPAWSSAMTRNSGRSGSCPASCRPSSRSGWCSSWAAAMGLIWHDRGLSFRAAARKLRRAS